MKLEHLSIIAWLQKYAIRTESGKPFDLRSHLYLFDFLADTHPKQVMMKGAQLGASTAQIIKTLWLARHRGYSIAYTLPTHSFAMEFARTKVNPIIQQNPVLKAYVKDGDNLGDKRVGNANVFFRGSFSEEQAISFTADCLIFDEVDRSDQRVLGTYASRLQHSAYKGEFYFSNPSVPGNGVSRFWAVSDQRHWFIRCRSCSKEQFLSFPESICTERAAYQCKFCHAILPDEARRSGRWVQKYRDREFHGYWASLLMAPWVSAREILAYHATKTPEYFHNFVLGLPYVGGGNTVPRDVILGNCTERINSQEYAVIGCDSGLQKHYVIGNREGLFFFGKTETWETIRGLLKEHPKWIAVIDALPDLTEPRRLVEEFPGRVFLCHYARDRKTMELVRWGTGKEQGHVTVDRNRTLQLVIDEFRDGLIPLQGRSVDWEPFYSHWETLYRVEEVDALGSPVHRWETSNGNDHWCHAATYFRVGMDRMLAATGGTLVGIYGQKMPGVETGYTISPDGRMPLPTQMQRTNTQSDEWRI